MNSLINSQSVKIKDEPNDYEHYMTFTDEDVMILDFKDNSDQFQNNPIVQYVPIKEEPLDEQTNSSMSGVNVMPNSGCPQTLLQSQHTFLNDAIRELPQQQNFSNEPLPEIDVHFSYNTVTKKEPNSDQISSSWGQLPDFNINSSGNSFSFDINSSDTSYKTNASSKKGSSWFSNQVVSSHTNTIPGGVVNSPHRLVKNQENVCPSTIVIKQEPMDEDEVMILGLFKNTGSKNAYQFQDVYIKEEPLDDATHLDVSAPGYRDVGLQDLPTDTGYSPSQQQNFDHNVPTTNNLTSTSGTSHTSPEPTSNSECNSPDSDINLSSSSNQSAYSSNSSFKKNLLEQNVCDDNSLEERNQTNSFRRKKSKEKDFHLRMGALLKQYGHVNVSHRNNRVRNTPNNNPSNSAQTNIPQMKKSNVFQHNFDSRKREINLHKKVLLTKSSDSRTVQDALERNNHLTLESNSLMKTAVLDSPTVVRLNLTEVNGKSNVIYRRGSGSVSNDSLLSNATDRSLSPESSTTIDSRCTTAFSVPDSRCSTAFSVDENINLFVNGGLAPLSYNESEEESYSDYSSQKYSNGCLPNHSTAKQSEKQHSGGQSRNDWYPPSYLNNGEKMLTHVNKKEFIKINSKDNFEDCVLQNPGHFSENNFNGDFSVPFKRLNKSTTVYDTYNLHSSDPITKDVPKPSKSLSKKSYTSNRNKAKSSNIPNDNRNLNSFNLGTADRKPSSKKESKKVVKPPGSKARVCKPKENQSYRNYANGMGLLPNFFKPFSCSDPRLNYNFQTYMNNFANLRVDDTSIPNAYHTKTNLPFYSDSHKTFGIRNQGKNLISNDLPVRKKRKYVRKKVPVEKNCLNDTSSMQLAKDAPTRNKPTQQPVLPLETFDHIEPALSSSDDNDINSFRDDVMCLDDNSENRPKKTPNSPQQYPNKTNSLPSDSNLFPEVSTPARNILTETSTPVHDSLSTNIEQHEHESLAQSIVHSKNNSSQMIQSKALEKAPEKRDGRNDKYVSDCIENQNKPSNPAMAQLNSLNEISDDEGNEILSYYEMKDHENIKTSGSLYSKQVLEEFFSENIQFQTDNIVKNEVNSFSSTQDVIPTNTSTDTTANSSSINLTNNQQNEHLEGQKITMVCKSEFISDLNTRYNSSDALHEKYSNRISGENMTLSTQDMDNRHNDSCNTSKEQLKRKLGNNSELLSMPILTNDSYLSSDGFSSHPKEDPISSTIQDSDPNFKNTFLPFNDVHIMPLNGNWDDFTDLIYQPDMTVKHYIFNPKCPVTLADDLDPIQFFSEPKLVENVNTEPEGSLFKLFLIETRSYEKNGFIFQQMDSYSCECPNFSISYKSVSKECSNFLLKLAETAREETTEIDHQTNCPSITYNSNNTLPPTTTTTTKTPNIYTLCIWPARTGTSGLQENNSLNNYNPFISDNQQEDTRSSLTSITYLSISNLNFSDLIQYVKEGKALYTNFQFSEGVGFDLESLETVDDESFNRYLDTPLENNFPAPSYAPSSNLNVSSMVTKKTVTVEHIIVNGFECSSTIKGSEISSENGFSSLWNCESNQQASGPVYNSMDCDSDDSSDCRIVGEKPSFRSLEARERSVTNYLQIGLENGSESCDVSTQLRTVRKDAPECVFKESNQSLNNFQQPYSLQSSNRIDGNHTVRNTEYSCSTKAVHSYNNIPNHLPVCNPYMTSNLALNTTVFEPPVNSVQMNQFPSLKSGIGKTASYSNDSFHRSNQLNLYSSYPPPENLILRSRNIPFERNPNVAQSNFYNLNSSQRISQCAYKDFPNNLLSNESSTSCVINQSLANPCFVPQYPTHSYGLPCSKFTSQSHPFPENTLQYGSYFPGSFHNPLERLASIAATSYRFEQEIEDCSDRILCKRQKIGDLENFVSEFDKVKKEPEWNYHPAITDSHYSKANRFNSTQETQRLFLQTSGGNIIRETVPEFNLTTEQPSSHQVDQNRNQIIRQNYNESISYNKSVPLKIPEENSDFLPKRTLSMIQHNRLVKDNVLEMIPNYLPYLNSISQQNSIQEGPTDLRISADMPRLRDESTLEQTGESSINSTNQVDCSSLTPSSVQNSPTNQTTHSDVNLYNSATNCSSDLSVLSSPCPSREFDVHFDPNFSSNNAVSLESLIQPHTLTNPIYKTNYGFPDHIAVPGAAPFQNSQSPQALPNSTQPNHTKNLQTENMDQIIEEINQAISDRNESRLVDLLSVIEDMNDIVSVSRVKAHLAHWEGNYDEMFSIISRVTFPIIYHEELKRLWLEGSIARDNPRGGLPHQFKPSQANKAKKNNPYPPTINIESNLVLTKEYDIDPYPKTSRRLELALLIGRSENKVNTWFKNRRQRDRKRYQQNVWLSPPAAQWLYGTTRGQARRNVSQFLRDDTFGLQVISPSTNQSRGLAP